jgi:hypothetical protein
MLTIAPFCSKNAINISNSYKCLAWKEEFITYVQLGGVGLLLRCSVANVMRANEFLRSEKIAVRNAKAAALRKAEADAAAQRKAADKYAAAKVKAAEDAAAAKVKAADDAAAAKVKAAEDAAAAQVKAADDAAAADLFLLESAFLIKAWKKEDSYRQHEEVSVPITCLFFCALCNPTHK